MRAPTLALFLTTLSILTLLSPLALAADVEVQLPAGDGFVVKDNTGAIERLRIDEVTGNISRNGALFVHTTGTKNIFVGESAGNTGTSGTGYNSAFGEDALRYNTTGHSNSAFGPRALFTNTTGYENSAFGRFAMNNNTEGKQNTAFGERALAVNTTGSYCSRRASRSNTSKRCTRTAASEL